MNWKPRYWVDKWFPKIPILSVWYKWVTRNDDDIEVKPINTTRIVKIKDGFKGSIEFDTHGIVPQSRDNDKNLELIFFQAEGENIDRFILYTCKGNGRIGRIILESDFPKGHMLYFKCKDARAFTDNLPDWHKWSIIWGGGTIGVYLDGKLIDAMKKPVPFHGVIEKIYIGGYKDDSRRFYGQWRNLKVNGELI